MKKTLLIISGIFLLLANAYSQASFSTGVVRVDVNEYGELELFTNSDTYMLDRASILVGMGENAVFDYVNDADTEDPTVLVENPAISDFEIYGSFNNAYSGVAPSVLVKLNVYAWNSQGYALAKYTIINRETAAFNAKVGLDIIPYINEEYGYDTVTYNVTDKYTRFHRGAVGNMGIANLTTDLSSLYSFEWYSDYSVDSDYWTWLNNGSLQPQYVSTTADGPVTITSQAPVNLNPGDSTIVWYSYALGIDEADLTANLQAAKAKLNLILSATKPQEALSFALDQNYPNPAINSTRVDYTLKQSGSVKLALYDMYGKEINVLVNENQSAGTRQLKVNTEHLQSGVYYYTLTVNGQSVSRKMTISK
jgi:hypothetical protein